MGVATFLIKLRKKKTKKKRVEIARVRVLRIFKRERALLNPLIKEIEREIKNYRKEKEKKPYILLVVDWKSSLTPEQVETLKNAEPDIFILNNTCLAGEESLCSALTRKDVWKTVEEKPPKTIKLELLRVLLPLLTQPSATQKTHQEKA